MPLMRMSLRMRLTLWFVVIFSSIYLAVLGGVWLLHRDLANRAMYQRLNGLAEGVALNLAEPDAVIAPGTLHRYQPMDRRHSILAVRDEQGNVLVARFGVDTDSLPPIPDSPPAPNEGVLYSFEGDTAERLIGRNVSSMMIMYRFKRPDGKNLYLDLARMIDINAEEPRFFIDAFIAGALGALLASVVAAWLIAGRAVDPIMQIAEAARGVDPEHLDTRVSVESTDHEFDRLQTELNNALNRLEEGYRSQERFISHAAHDLKTPIAVMLTETQVFDPQKAGTDELIAYHASVMKEMRRLGNLVEGFLTLARADQGEALARKTEVSVNDLILDSVAHCTAQAKQSEVRIVTRLDDNNSGDPPLTLQADPDLLRTMVENLLRNAIRYSPPGEPVEISIRRVAGHAAIQVKDHGPGIPEDQIDKIFDRYYVIECKEGNNKNGSGLGLAIAMSVAQMHRGTIKAQNAEEGGSIFTVTLPISDETATSLSSQAPPDTSA